MNLVIKLIKDSVFKIKYSINSLITLKLIYIFVLKHKRLNIIRDKYFLGYVNLLFNIKFITQ